MVFASLGLVELPRGIPKELEHARRFASGNKTLDQAKSQLPPAAHRVLLRAVSLWYDERPKQNNLPRGSRTADCTPKRQPMESCVKMKMQGISIILSLKPLGDDLGNVRPLLLSMAVLARIGELGLPKIRSTFCGGVSP